MTTLNSMVVLALQVDVQGNRFNSDRGERKTVLWRTTTPRIVELARAGKPVDWGGAMVRHGDYLIDFDGLAREYPARAATTKEE